MQLCLLFKLFHYSSVTFKVKKTKCPTIIPKTKRAKRLISGKEREIKLIKKIKDILN